MIPADSGSISSYAGFMIMTPVDKVKVAHPNQDALSILEQMDENNINQMPVVSEGRVIGLIARDNLIRFLRTRSELGI